MNSYLLDNRHPEAGERFAALAEIFDSWTFRHLDDQRPSARHRHRRLVGSVRDPPPAETFDLVHARLVLVHLKDRAAAKRVMIDALRPRGWLAIENGDPALQPFACPDERGPDEALANKLRIRIRTLMAERGADFAHGRTLPRLLDRIDAGRPTTIGGGDHRHDRGQNRAEPDP